MLSLNFTNTRQRGAHAESQACSFLKKQGLRLVESNFTTKAGEVDLVMRDGEILVFVEVRHRKQSDFGDGASSVTPRKQQRLANAAALYLQKHPRSNHAGCRFDVVSIDGPLAHARISWIKDAFSL